LAILVAPTTTPPDGGPGGGIPDNWLGPELGPYLTWTSADGRVTSLEDFRDWSRGTMALPGVLGLGMPSYAIYEDSSPAFDGATVRGVPRAQPRDVTVPVHIWADTRSECLARWRQWISDLNPQNGPGVITVYERDGSSRQISALYSQGIEGAADDDGTGPTWFTFAVVFHASRPYWLGDEQARTFTLASGGSFYPFLPLIVTNSSPGGAVQVTNSGDTASFPVWTVTGPCTSLTLTNDSTGQALTVDYALNDGDSLVIDTTDGAKYVLLNGATNLWPALSLGSKLWSLRNGLNNLTIAAPGAGVHTSVTIAFRERYLTAT
jgi:hypothetical protein